MTAGGKGTQRVSFGVSASRRGRQPMSERLAPGAARRRRRARRRVDRHGVPRPGGHPRRQRRSRRPGAHRRRAELGYVANPHARSLAGGATSSIGLIVHEIGDPYFSEIASGVLRVAAAAGPDRADLPLRAATPQSRAGPDPRARRAPRRRIIVAGSGFVDPALEAEAQRGAARRSRRPAAAWRSSVATTARRRRAARQLEARPVDRRARAVARAPPDRRRVRVARA